jgi:hypothetical protein
VLPVPTMHLTRPPNSMLLSRIRHTMSNNSALARHWVSTRRCLRSLSPGMVVGFKAGALGTTYETPVFNST